MEAAGLKGGLCRNNSSYIDALDDDLLSEILVRVACTQSATRCKCVSKRWFRHISSPSFIAGFLSHNYHDNPESGSSSSEEKSLEIQLPFSFLCHSVGTSRLTKLFPRDSAFECNRGLSFDFLPLEIPLETDQNLKSEELLRIRTQLVGASYDLVIFEFFRASYSTMRSEEPPINYLLCNPRTMQWAQLPPLRRKSMEPYKVGFICKPYDRIDGKTTTLEDQYGYRVVYIRGDDFSEPLQIEIFSSETQLWMQHVLSCHVEGNDNPILSESVAYKGKLHWLTTENIVAFDPFDATEGGIINCRLISWSASLPYPAPLSLGVCLGVCGGYLRICMGHPPSSYKVWELKDYDEGEWSFKHNISLSELEVPQIPNWHSHTPLEDAMSFIGRVVGFHPYNGDIIYVEFSRFILSCNLQTKVLEMVPEIKSSAYYYLLMLPRWPTPIRPHPNHGLL